MNTVPTFPGHLAVTDYNDDFRENMAYPSSGSFSEPVFGLWTEVVLPGFVSDWWIRIAFPGDEANTLGVGPAAGDGYDPNIDVVDENLAVTFLRPEWAEAGSTAFLTDYRAPYDLATVSKTWDFTVNVPANLQGSFVSLSLSTSFPAGELPRLVLEDHQLGLNTELGPDLSYRFYAGAATRTFSLHVGDSSALPDGVRVGIAANASGHSSGQIVAGVHDAAGDSYDGGLDLPLPAPPPGNYVSAAFEHDGWPFGPRFSSDIRAPYDPLATGKTWPLLIETDQTGQLSITFAPNFGEEVQLILHDLQTDEYRSLFPDLIHTASTDGPTSLRYELIIGGVTEPPLTPSSRTIQAGWSLIAPPLIPAPGSESLDDVVLNQVPGYSYVFSHVPNSGYGMVPGEATTTVGKGYWLATDTDFSWTMSGTPAYESVAIPLATGWNLFGYPIWFPGFTDGIRVSSGGITVAWADAQAAGWVSGIMGYDQAQDDYVGATELVPWTGYWVASMRSDLAIHFSWLNFLGGKSAAKSTLELPVSFKHWRTVVTLDDGSGKVRSATFGADERATDGFDAVFDLPRPPAGPSGGASLAVVRPEWDLPSGNLLAADITAPVDGRDAQWRLRITPYRPGTVTLDWSNRRWPDGQDFQLYLPGQNRVVVHSMRNRLSVELEVGSQPLDIIVRTPNEVSGVDDEIPFAGFGLMAHPNPFNPQTTITFALPRDGRSEVRIYSVRGELVTVLDGGVLTAGLQQLTWRGTDRAGRNVPSGSYFARLLLDGEHVGETAKMSLIR